jgi:hypothetical protein
VRRQIIWNSQESTFYEALDCITNATPALKLLSDIDIQEELNKLATLTPALRCC